MQSREKRRTTKTISSLYVAKLGSENGSVDLEVAQGNLTQLSGTAGAKQLKPSVDTDGTKFIVTYEERFEGTETDYDIYSQTFCKYGAPAITFPGLHGTALKYS